MESPSNSVIEALDSVFDTCWGDEEAAEAGNSHQYGLQVSESFKNIFGFYWIFQSWFQISCVVDNNYVKMKVSGIDVSGQRSI